MKRRILKKPQVERDLIDQFAYIARDKVEPAERFLRVAEESFNYLATNPLVGQKWESPLRQLAGIRVYPCRRRSGNTWCSTVQSRTESKC
jgi:plasmid stabilization system protein ParE